MTPPPDEGNVTPGRGVDRGAGVELLRDLVVECEERDRRRLVESDQVEQLDDVVGDAKVGLSCAADLIVTKLERHTQPVAPCEHEPDQERPHDVVVGHPSWLWRVLRLDLTHEAAVGTGPHPQHRLHVLVDKLRAIDCTLAEFEMLLDAAEIIEEIDLEPNGIKELLLVIDWTRPLHIVVVVDSVRREERLVTVCEPHADRWADGYRRRR